MHGYTPCIIAVDAFQPDADVFGRLECSFVIPTAFVNADRPSSVRTPSDQYATITGA
jgi:hypothetical protein